MSSSQPNPPAYQLKPAASGHHRVYISAAAGRGALLSSVQLSEDSRSGSFCHFCEPSTMQLVAVLAAALVCSLIASGSAQTPCCGPRQFQGLHAVRFSPNGTYQEAFSSVAYDFTRQLVASNETLIGNRIVRHQRVLVDGNRRAMYIVDHHSRECRIIALTRGIDPPCVPNDFRGEGSLHFGAGNDLLNFNSFRGRVSDLDVQLAVTRASCVPISQLAFSPRFHESESYVNVTIGIRDASVFRVPPECTRAGLTASRLTQQQLLATSPLVKSFFLGRIGF